MAPEVPEFADLKSLLKIVFLASLQREEGRPIQIRVAFVPDETSASLKQYTSMGDVFSFAQPLPLSVETLRKVAPAFDQNTTTLVVTCSSSHEYQLVGALFYGRVTLGLDSDTSSLPRPPVLTLSTRVPGSVVVAYGDRVVGHFNQGRFAVAKPGLRASFTFINMFIEVIKRHELYQRYENTYWKRYGDCIERIYTSIAAPGHGGTVIWVPDALLSAASKYLQSGTEIAKSPLRSCCKTRAEVN